MLTKEQLKINLRVKGTLSGRIGSIISIGDDNAFIVLFDNGEEQRCTIIGTNLDIYIPDDCS